MKFKTEYPKIKEELTNYIGQEVNIKYHGERNNEDKYKCVIEGANSEHFYVRRSDIGTRESYQYSAFLRNALEMTSVDSGEPLLNFESDADKKPVIL